MPQYLPSGLPLLNAAYLPIHSRLRIALGAGPLRLMLY
jgi:hypothetical protein